jgi:hypothetical protein
MKKSFFVGLPILLLFLACQGAITHSVEITNAQQKPPHEVNNQAVETKEEEVWTPTSIEDCMAKANVGEQFAFETSFNPFYLRADLDGNNFIDYAVLIKGQDSKKRAVVICKDSKQPFIFGELSKPKTPFSSFDNDNFVTNQWEISTKEETREWIVRHSEERKVDFNAKGESIVFLFEGGDGLVIYWNGKTFMVAE